MCLRIIVIISAIFFFNFTSTEACQKVYGFSFKEKLDSSLVNRSKESRICLTPRNFRVHLNGTSFKTKEKLGNNVAANIKSWMTGSWLKFHPIDKYPDMPKEADFFGVFTTLKTDRIYAIASNILNSNYSKNKDKYLIQNKELIDNFIKKYGHPFNSNNGNDINLPKWTYAFQIPCDTSNDWILLLVEGKISEDMYDTQLVSISYSLADVKFAMEADQESQIVFSLEAINKNKK